MRIDPGNREWVAQSGLAHNNLAKMALLRGDLAAAVAGYQADLDIEVDLARRDPQNNDQAEKVVLSRAALGRTLAMSGDVDTGIAHLRQALGGVARLLVVDAENTSFQEDEGLYSIQLARWLRVTSDAQAARAHARRGLAVFERLASQDPDNAGWQRSLAVALIEQAEHARDTGRGDLARDHATRALGILEPQLAEQAENRDTVLATLVARLLLATVVDDLATATTLRKQTLVTAQAQLAGRNDPRLLALQVEALLALGRKPQAQALLPGLWHTGFRDPWLLSLLRQHDIQTPALAARTPADALPSRDHTAASAGAGRR